VKYRVLNPLLSVRKSKNNKSPEYNVFINWKAGDLMAEWPEHTAITEWLAAGHIEEADDGED
jgi:hypothetical protein